MKPNPPTNWFILNLTVLPSDLLSLTMIKSADYVKKKYGSKNQIETDLTTVKDQKNFLGHELPITYFTMVIFHIQKSRIYD